VGDTTFLAASLTMFFGFAERSVSLTSLSGWSSPRLEV